MTFEGQSLPRRGAAKKQRYSSANYELPQRRQLALLVTCCDAATCLQLGAKRKSPEHAQVMQLIR